MPNRLIQSQSLYLRKHAENPIDWWPWCDEALETARTQDKPIFLSVGYSSCHWCTVMEGEAFSDPMIADYMNANFIPIKVDREERPDIDSIYMQAVQIMGENGGWPLNLFLTPDDLIPFYGGTYFPIEPRYGRPGFLRVLQSLHQIYTEKRLEIQDYKSQIAHNLRSVTQLDTSSDLNKEALAAGIIKCAEVVVNRDRGTCFPMIPYANLVLRGSRLTNLDIYQELRQKAEQRGLDLVLGGIFDHVAGGWHRYTVDATWTVPHFEKMLYDNGQILEFLANLWAAGMHEPAIKRAVAQTVVWLQREMLTEEGYFYASQDADSEGKEGKFWVWSYSELKRLFTEAELKLLIAEFTITPQGNFEEQNVLQRQRQGELSPEVEACLLKLFRLRYGEHSVPTDAFPPARNSEEIKAINWTGRVPPVTDTKMIVAWNALTISGLARAYQVFGDEKYKELAVNAANYILQNQWVNKRLHRVSYDGNPSVMAQSEDYALLIKALLDLEQACPEPGNRLGNFYLDRAVKVQEEFDHWFWDDEVGGYFSTAANNDQNLPVRERSYQDNAIPSANGIAIANLIRLSVLTQNVDYLTQAEKALQAFSSAINNTAIACPSLITALDWFHNNTLVRTNATLYAELQQAYHPVTALQISENLPTDDAIALVCKGLACLDPATTPAQLQQQLLASATRYTSG